MFLKSLTLKGFKSFADPAVLEFEPGVTVVVGPNGSGKSNVVDAVAWVLGAQGPRTVRSSKMEDVIFAGTANRPALGRAEVSLTIDNSSGKLASDLAEITITRTLFRSGDSEYAINGAPCRLLDVQELLSDTGVGRQQHVIISQGQLDAILNARPEDRRSVIEEAAGVLKFRRRRERSERRLASTEENLERLHDLVREVKRQIRPLERQAAAARSHAELADELRAVRLHVAGTELAALDGRHADGTALQARLRGSEETLRASLAELDAATSRTTDELSTQREADLATSLGRVEGMVERARGLTGVLRERQRSLTQALDAAADADVVSTLEAEGARLGSELEGAEHELADLRPASRPPLDAEESAAAAALEAHLAGLGRRDRPPRRPTEAVTEARGQRRLARPRPRARPAGPGADHRPAGVVERRAAGLEGEDHELAERLAEHGAGPPPAPGGGGRDRGGPRRRRAPPGGGRGGAPAGRAGAPPVGRPGPTPWPGPSTRPGGRPAPSSWPGWTAWSAPSSTWSRSTRAGRTPSRRRPAPRWRRWWCRAASRPGRPGPPAPGGGHRGRPGPDRGRRRWSPPGAGDAGVPPAPTPSAPTSAAHRAPPGSPASTAVLDTLLAGRSAPVAGGPTPSTWR